MGLCHFDSCGVRFLEKKIHAVVRFNLTLKADVSCLATRKEIYVIKLDCVWLGIGLAWVRAGIGQDWHRLSTWYTWLMPVLTDTIKLSVRTAVVIILRRMFEICLSQFY